jgi:RNA polymerase sporulation-specific sigma factor
MINILKKILQLLHINNCYYASNLESLLPPLSKEEEIKYIIKNMQGDLNARNKLIEHNLRLVVFLAKKFDNTSFDLEDLVSIGTIGLIKGVKTYKLDKNIKLATYVSRCISNEILMFLRKNKRTITEVSLEDTLNYDNEGNALSLEDVLGTEIDIVDKDFQSKNDKELLEKEISKLPKRDKEIMIMRYGLYNQKDYTQKEIADKLNISQSYISRIEKKVIKRIKYLLKI